MTDASETTEQWLRRMATREPVTGVGVVPLRATFALGTDGAPTARLVRHAEELLVELFALDPGARSETEAELVVTEAALPAGSRAALALLRRDLAMLDGVDEPDGSPAPADLLERLERANAGQEWVALLDLLRAAPTMVPEETRAYARGRAWQMLGFVVAAVPFFERAVELSVAPHFLDGLLEALHRAGRTMAAAERAEAILDGRSSPSARIVAARALYLAVSLRPANARRTAYERVVAVTDAALGDPVSADPIERMLLRRLVPAVRIIRGFALEHLGRDGEAARELDAAIEAQPDNVGARVARAMHRVMRHREAVDDLEFAVREDVAFVPAYLFLANTHLDRGAFVECRRVCERGLRWRSDPPIESALREMLGISLAKQIPADMTRAIVELSRAATLATGDAHARVLSSLAEVRDAQARDQLVTATLVRPDMRDLVPTAGASAERMFFASSARAAA